MAPASPAVRPVTSSSPRIISRGHCPRTFGAATSAFLPRRAGVEARPYGGWLRGLTGNVVSPHPCCPQPLSHGASRRDSSPFRGAEGWAEVCGVYAFVYHDAHTFVPLMPVRGGVLDAPRSRDCRAALGASARRGRRRPRLIRCARLASIAPRIIIPHPPPARLWHGSVRRRRPLRAKMTGPETGHFCASRPRAVQARSDIMDSIRANSAVSSGVKRSRMRSTSASI